MINKDIFTLFFYGYCFVENLTDRSIPSGGIDDPENL